MLGGAPFLLSDPMSDWICVAAAAAEVVMATAAGGSGSLAPMRRNCCRMKDGGDGSLPLLSGDVRAALAPLPPPWLESDVVLLE